MVNRIVAHLRVDVTNVFSVHTPYMADSFLMHRINEIEEGPEVQASMNRCRRLLFEAGADPTLDLGEYYGSFIGNVLSVGTTVSKTPFQLWNTTTNRNEGITTDAFGLRSSFRPSRQHHKS